MPLQPIRDDVCLLDPRTGRRLEQLACGHPGRPLGRLTPTRFRHQPPSVTLRPDYLDWLRTWPTGPTHALIAQPTWRRPPATRRHCPCPAPTDTPAYWALLQPDPLLLHRWDDPCDPCGVTDPPAPDLAH